MTGVAYPQRPGGNRVTSADKPRLIPAGAHLPIMPSRSVRARCHRRSRRAVTECGWSKRKIIRAAGLYGCGIPGMSSDGVQTRRHPAISSRAPAASRFPGDDAGAVHGERRPGAARSGTADRPVLVHRRGRQDVPAARLRPQSRPATGPARQPRAGHISHRSRALLRSAATLRSVTAIDALDVLEPPICVATRFAALARRGAQIGMIWRCPDDRLMRVRRSLNG